MVWSSDVNPKFTLAVLVHADPGSPLSFLRLCAAHCKMPTLAGREDPLREKECQTQGEHTTEQRTPKPGQPRRAHLKKGTGDNT